MSVIPGHDHAAGTWIDLKKTMPLKHVQVLIHLRESAGGDVCDVACYVGQYQLPEGGVEERWILGDVRLDSRQITAWAPIRSPRQVEQDKRSRSEERDRDPFSDSDYFESGYCT